MTATGEYDFGPEPRGRYRPITILICVLAAVGLVGIALLEYAATFFTAGLMFDVVPPPLPVQHREQHLEWTSAVLLLLAAGVVLTAGIFVIHGWRRARSLALIGVTIAVAGALVDRDTVLRYNFGIDPWWLAVAGPALAAGLVMVSRTRLRVT